MKLSLTWIFDHIVSSWKEHNVPDLINKFNTTTAEIENYEYISSDLNCFTLVKVIAKKNDSIVAYSAELDQEFSLGIRPDLDSEDIFLIKNDNNQWRWAQGQDFKSEKEGLLPALYSKDQDFAGGWKEGFETEDYILTVGNTSITHRPDLWCHRGFAREIAAILNCQLKDENHFFTDYPIKYSNLMEDKAEQALTLVRQTEKCKRIAGLYISEISNRPSLLSMAHRLLRVDSRPINAIVDATNYVMFDIGQPMHAFDAAKLADKKLIAAEAKAGQSLTLLDDQTITLTKENIVISDGKKPLSLAGIMGGIESSVSEKTESLVIEAANFEASSIRNSAHHFKLRTESSTRFEKSLDSLQTTAALLRFLHLLEKNNIPYVAQGKMLCLGEEVTLHSIELSHCSIEKKLGVTIPQEFVVKTLLSLGFDVKTKQDRHEIIYNVNVPSLRAKDIRISEDVIEEIGRFFGFDRIPYELPALAMKPSDISAVQKVYDIKKILAYNASAREVYNYALYDEEFLKIMHWQPHNALTLKNPISEHMTRLVTSLIPNLFKNIYSNKAEEDLLNFFEWNKVWSQAPQSEKSKKSIIENSSLAGIFYDEKKSVDFYQKKDLLSVIFTMLGFTITWIKPDQEIAPWYHPYKTAILVHNDTPIGIAGSVNPGFIAPFLRGDAFIFELNGDLLGKIEYKRVVFKQLPKYQDTWLDISMFVPISISVARLSETIMKVSPTIFNVELIDFFQKEEWIDKRSITMRFFARDPNQTLSSNEIDTLYNHVLQALIPLGVEVR